jgi:hypothetical protein
MGVASPSIVNPSRNKALMVRLAPFLVETVCELTRAVRDKTHAQTEISGLLFGRSEDGLVTVEAIKTFKDSGPRSDLARRERMEKAFEAAMALAHDDPEFTPYRLLGWFSLRGGGGLISSDVEFHNRHFKDSDEVALIVWRESDTQITAELYARIEEGKLTSEDYRWSSVRLSSELRSVSQPIDLAMRLRINDDLYLRTYAVPDARDRKDEWRKVAKGALNSVLSLIPRRSQTPDYALEDLAPPPLEFAPAIEGSKVPLTPIPLRPLPKRELKRQPAFESKPEPEAKSELKIEPTPEPIAEPQLESQLETELEREPEPKLEVAPEPTPEPKPEPVEAKMPPLEAPLPQHEPESNPIAEEEKPVPAAARRPRHADTRILPIEPTPAAADYEPTRSARPRSAPELSGLPMVIQPRRLHHKGMPWLSMALVAVLFSGVTFALLALKGVGTGSGKLSQVMRVLFP